MTHNSFETIKDCLTSALFADEIIIIDDNSTDKTIEIIEQVGLKHPNVQIHSHYLHNNFAAQRNWALKKAKSEWIMYLDADEKIPENLKNEIIRIIKPIEPKQQALTSGYYIRRIDYLFDKELKYGETSQVKLLRLARKDKGEWNYQVHEEWQIKGKIDELTNALIHKRDITTQEFLSKINWYTSMRADELYQLQIKEPFWKIFIFPAAKFILNYFFKLGFMDGKSGFILAWLMSWHSFLVRIKLQIKWLTQDSKTSK